VEIRPLRCVGSPPRCVVAPKRWKFDRHGAAFHQISGNSTATVEFLSLKVETQFAAAGIIDNAKPFFILPILLILVNYADKSSGEIVCLD